MTICVMLKAQHQKAAIREPQPAKEEELQPAGEDFEIAFSDDESEQPVRPPPSFQLILTAAHLSS